MKCKRRILLLSIIFSLCACFFAYAYWTDKLKLKYEVKVNYPVQIVVLEDETEEEFTEEESTEEETKPETQFETKAEAQTETQAETKPQTQAETKPQTQAETKALEEVSVNEEAE